MGYQFVKFYPFLSHFLSVKMSKKRVGLVRRQRRQAHKALLRFLQGAPCAMARRRLIPRTLPRPCQKRGTPRYAGLGRAPAAHRRRRGPRQPGRPALRQPPSRREALRPVLRGNPLKTQKRRGILSGCPFVFSARRGGKGPLAAHGPCKKAFSYSCGRVSSCPGKIREGFEMSSRLSA